MLYLRSINKRKMKKLILLLFVLVLAACSAPQAAPTATQPVAVPPIDPTAEVAAPTETDAPSFEPAFYVDSAGRFEISYPAAWTVNDSQAGSRGSYVQITSWDPSAAGITEIPANESLLQITIYLWDPKNELAARLEMRKAAWLASGNVILEESEVVYPGDHSGVRVLMQDTAGNQNVIILLELGEDYLELTGIGNIALLDQIMTTFRFAS